MTKIYPMKYLVVNVFQSEIAAELQQPLTPGGSDLSQDQKVQVQEAKQSFRIPLAEPGL